MPRELPAAARQYRAAMWLMVLLAVAALVPAIAGARGTVPRTIGAASGAVAVAALLLGGALGLKGLRLAREARDKKAVRTALVLVAGMLKDKSSDELQLLADQGGMSSQAVQMVLAGRRAHQERSTPRPSHFR